MGVMKKDTRIKKEKKRLTNIYKDLPEKKKSIAEGLIDRASYIRVEMEDGSALPSGNYYAAVLPGSHKLTVTLTDQDGMTAERAMDAAKAFVSSHIRSIGSVKSDTFDNVEFVLGDAAVSGETKTLVMSAKIPAGTYTMEQLLGVTSYPYKGDKAIYVIDNLYYQLELVKI